MANQTIQWFPGHMAKTQRIIRECLPDVDLVIELLDARIPYSSKNPGIDKTVGDKPKLTVLTKTSLADPQLTRAWMEHYAAKGVRTVAIDAVAGSGINDLASAVNDLMRDKLDRYKEKGMEGRKLRAMIVGIPNVGKSSLINRLAGGKRAKVENRPGVTLAKQWVPTSIGLDLLDMPGVLAPKFEDNTVGENLAITGAIRDTVLHDIEEIAMILAVRLTEYGKSAFLDRYKLSEDEIDGLDGYDLLTLVGKKRGFLVRGGEVNLLRTAEMLIEEYRSGTIGRITLERP